jgi:hypothetical protein
MVGELTPLLTSQKLGIKIAIYIYPNGLSILQSESIFTDTLLHYNVTEGLLQRIRLDEILRLG